jgi:hypothetical protein
VSTEGKERTAILCDPLGVLGAAAIPLHGEEMPSPASREDAADEEILR